MTVHVGSGSPVVRSQQYQTLPIRLIANAEQHDRALSQTELKELLMFFQSGLKRSQIAATIAQHSTEIVTAGAERIFFGGSAIAYLDPPANREHLPGYAPFPKPVDVRPKERLKVQTGIRSNYLKEALRFVQVQLTENREPLPDGFRPIPIWRYGEVRMRRSMRDLGWFLRYVVYAIVAGDSSIVTVNVRGLRGVIPEDVTEATVVAIQDMKWKALSYFKADSEAQELIQQEFDQLVAEYVVQKPTVRVRQGVSNEQQGLQLPESYALSATTRQKFVMKPNLSVTEQNNVVKAAYRQVFERDITREYGVTLSDLESRWKEGQLSTKELVRQLGKSRLYRKLFYEPFTISRIVELSVRHFLGRGIYSIEEFQTHFETITEKGFPALIDSLIDSTEYADYFGEETVPYLRGLGQEAQECRNWGAQHELFKFSASTHKAPQFITMFGHYQHPLPNQHPYGVGHDLLETQFGAVFPKPEWKHLGQVGEFSPNHRRILIETNNKSEHWAKIPGANYLKVLKLNPIVHSQENLNGSIAVNAVIEGVYQQLFGRQIYVEQRSQIAEAKLKSGEITVKELVRQVAKSRVFRQIYWEELYVTKAIEAIHRRILGRPTQTRQEIAQYYDICARHGFYALIDQLIDSREYAQAFGQDTVPYERSITPQGYQMRVQGRAGSLPQLHESAGNPVNGSRVADRTWIKAIVQQHSSNGKVEHQHSLELPTLPEVEIQPESVEV
ncbi:phycobilisome rod-core linker polypeptide [Leptolyngbya sp. AN03gr2]|uniref:phycobilisome rod-core linker polypeptide n=1 Tax=unclassified Leptolyngbya TaxID=2650499 RepID=UPI003D31ABDB